MKAQSEVSKTYCIKLRDDGSIYCPITNVLQVLVGDSIFFQVNRASPIATNSHLLVNQPKSELKARIMTPISNITKDAKPDETIKENLTSYNPIEKSESIIEFQVIFKYPGNFFYQIEYLDKELSIINYTKAEWILVQPQLLTQLKPLPIESLIIQVNMGKSLGKFKDWPKMLDSQVKLGYNAFHFLPVQKCDKLGSPYDINDQLSIDNFYFEDEKLSADDQYNLLSDTLKEIRGKYGALCFTDIILNRTSINSEWLVVHPECAYNLSNCPYLKAGWILDKFLGEFSKSYALKAIPECKYAPYISNETDLASVMDALRNGIKKLSLEHYFMYDKGKIMRTVEDILKTTVEKPVEKSHNVNILDFITENSFGYGRRPYGVELNTEKVVHMMLENKEIVDNIDNLWNELDNHLNECNARSKIKYEQFINEALGNIESNLRYEKLELDNHMVTKENPIVRRYFVELKDKSSGRIEDEFIALRDGWCPTTNDIANPTAFYQLRRSVKPLEDSIKLYYGETPKDNPYLWSHMEKYIEKIAGSFDGFCIINCNETPINVLQYFLDYARSINNSLFVYTNLSNAEYQVEADYVRRAGINAFLREAIYINDADVFKNILRGANKDSSTNIEDEKAAIILRSSLPREIVCDFLHTDCSPMQVWNTQAMLPLICCISMTNTPIGSIRGVDELWTYGVNLRAEKRLYQTLNDVDEKIIPIMGPKKSIGKFVYVGPATKVAVAGSFNGWSPVINPLKTIATEVWEADIELSAGKYYYKFVLDDTEWVLGKEATETDLSGNTNNIMVIEESKDTEALPLMIYKDLRTIRLIMNKIHQSIAANGNIVKASVTNDIMIITQQYSETNLYFLVSRPNFVKGMNSNPNELTNLVVTLPGDLDEIIFTCNIYIDQTQVEEFVQDKNYLKGLEGKIYRNLDKEGLKNFATINVKQGKTTFEFFKMPSSFSMLLSVKMSESQIKLLKQYESIANPPLSGLSISSMNHLLFRCNEEEKDSSGIGRTIYEFKGFAPNYAGFAGLFIGLNDPDSDAYKIIIENITEGDWLIEYYLQRISEVPEMKSVLAWLMKYLAPIKDLPASLKAKLFFKVVSVLFKAAKKAIMENAPAILKQDEFGAALMMSIYQFIGTVPSAAFRYYKETIGAGLPYLAAQYARCWGRHTMISLRGLVMIPNRLQEARKILLTFASVCRHGLIPNLLDRGIGARYNARDATWYFMEALQDYVKYDTVQGYTIFKQKVDMMFLSAKQDEHYKLQAEGKKLEMTFEDVVQQIMQSHYQSIDFTEWDAGSKIDEFMTKEGFHINIWTDSKTGFIYGGNKYNCGTWMDKMGSSEHAGNRGVPATPRDGADVEIIGFLRSALRFLSKSYDTNLFSYEGVSAGSNILTYKEWGQLIDENFEKCFWIPRKGDSSDTDKYQIDSKFVQESGIYKDVFGSSDLASEYRFRPNFAIAMAVAPEMFNPEHAQYAIEKMATELITDKSLGIKSLHPSDKAYKPGCDNHDNGTDPTTALGQSYHMGTEWIWPLKYFVKAYMNFAADKSTKSIEEKVNKWLSNPKRHILSSPWMSLPEVTNADGAVNPSTCGAHASSVAAVIEVLDDLRKYKENTK